MFLFSLVLSLLLAVCLYSFDFFTLTGLLNNLPDIIMYFGLYLGLGVLYSFLDHYLNAREFNKKLNEAYSEFVKDNSGYKSFGNYFNDRFSFDGKFTLDRKTLEVKAYYLNKTLPSIVVCWWLVLLSRLFKHILYEFVVWIVGKFKGIYSYITYLTINTTMKKISDLRIDTNGNL